MNSKHTDSNRNHPILIYWSEENNCFIAEAPDCLIPVRLEPDGGETGIQEQVEPLQGKGASHAKALADALRRVEVWAGQQRVTPTELGSRVPRASPGDVDGSLYGRRRVGVVACLTVFILGCSVFALSEWPPDLLSTLQSAQKAEGVSPTTAIVSPTPESAPPTGDGVSPTADGVSPPTVIVPPTAVIVPTKLVVSALEVSSKGAVRGGPRELSVSLEWSVSQPGAGHTSKINMECTLTRARKTLRESVRPAQRGSYKICRAVLSTDQHELTIELPDRIPAGDYELRTAIWLEHEAPELLVRQVSIPEATTSPKRIPVARNTHTSEPAQRTKNL